MAVREVLVFDVNETLLDVGAMRPAFAEAFGNGTLLEAWFARMIRNAMVSALTKTYAPFPDQGVAAALAVARAAGVPLDAAQARTLVAAMEELPAHGDVAPALTMLAEGGFRLGTLTNSPSDVAERQLRSAGIADFFEHRMSVESVEAFKPHPAPYRHAAARFAVSIGRMRMVAAHAWDVTGAMRAGALGAFVARSGAVPGMVDESPDVIGSDLIEVAGKLIAERPR